MLQHVRALIRKAGILFAFVATLVVVITLFFSFTRHDSVGAAGEQRLSLEKSNQKNEQEIAKVLLAHKDEHPFLTVLTQQSSCTLMGMLCDLVASSHGTPVQGESAAKFVSQLISLPLRHMPASGIHSVEQTLANAGFIPNAYAQGIGFGVFAPFKSVWKAMRDFSYLAIVLIAIVVGFMVMFQVGSDSKAGVTLEATLPRIVFVLIAISLSYALAGFFVDVMYITIIFVVYLLAPAAGLDPGSQQTLLNGVMSGVGTSGGLFGYMFGLQGGWAQFNYWNLGDSLWTLVPEQLQAMALSLISAVWTRMMWVFVGGSASADSNVPIKGLIESRGPLQALKGGPTTLIQNILGKGVAAPLSTLLSLINEGKSSGAGTWAVSVISALVYFLIYSLLSTFISTIILKLVIVTILILTMFWILIRIMFFLFKVYTEIIINIFAAPIVMLVDIVPGQSMFVSWVRGLLTNLMIFPLTVMFFLIVRILMNQSLVGGSIWAPPFLASITDMGSFIMIVAGFILYMIPDFLEAFKEKVGGKSSLPFSASPGVFFTGVAPIITMGASFLGASGIGKALANQVSAPAAAFAQKTASKVLGIKPLEQVKNAG